MTERVFLKRSNKRVMRDFMIKEISAVDRPAQGHARMTLMKRDGDGDDKEFNKLTCVETLVKRYIDPSDGPISLEAVVAENKSEEDYWDRLRIVSPYINALETSLRSIAGAGDVSEEDKISSMRSSVESFMALVRTESMGLAKALDKTFSGIDAGDNGNSKGDETMTDAEKKLLSDLQKQNDELIKKLETVTAASTDAKKAGELQEQIDTLSKGVDELTEKLEKAAVDAVEKDAEIEKAKMPVDQREHMATLGKEDKAKFMSLSADERKQAMKKTLEDDEVLEIAGKSIRKSAVGEDMFAVVKAQQEENKNNADKLAKSESETRRTKLEKRAEDEISHLPGTAAEKADVLGAMESMDEATRGALTKILETAEKTIVAGFDRFGHNYNDDELGDVQKKAVAFEKHVSEIQAAEKCSGTDAMKRARERHPDEFEAYQEAGNPRG